MKRSYVLVYLIVVLALLFMIVVTLSDRLVENQVIYDNQRDSLKERYEFESAGHRMITDLSEGDYLTSKLYRSTKNQTEARERIDLNKYGLDDTGTISYKDRSIEILIGDPYSYYRLICSIRPYNEYIYSESLIYDSKEDGFNEIFSSDLIEGLYEDINEIDKASISRDENGLYSVDMEAENVGSDQDSLEEELYINQDTSAIEKQASIEEVEREISNNDDIEPINENDGGWQTGPSENNNPNGGHNDSQTNEIGASDELINNEEIIGNNTENYTGPDHTNDLIEDKIEKSYISEEAINIYKDNIKYGHSGPLTTKGILYISDKTTISTDLTHYGIAIISGPAKFDKGSLTVRGGIFTDSMDYSGIDFKANRSLLFRYLYIFEGLYDPKIHSFVME